ncbi:hypothetical protein [Rhodoferax sediminis]|uniref:Uncharacterized protein n=1 Tax=Rhodoferax sediminis TaxID=2509614 RepID=A0A515D9Z0_9BURK|nr:hypothetical protein [Rhodoferax sediminis]QDL37204.1 hypothetical protein EUB48_07825 [Rhodoferax sediminis]
MKFGRSGSRRRSSYSGKPETSDSMPRDIRQITRTGLLVPASSFRLVKDRQVAGIGIRVDFESMVPSYCMKSTGEVVEQRVQTQTSPCHLGGQRHWFTCPRCSKRVAVLYTPGRYFACRQCGGLGYATQKEGAGDRGQQAAQAHGLGGWHLEWRRRQTQRHALDDLSTDQKPPRRVGASQLARRRPQARDPAQVTGGVNLFRKMGTECSHLDC